MKEGIYLLGLNVYKALFSVRGRVISVTREYVDIIWIVFIINECLRIYICNGLIDSKLSFLDQAFYYKTILKVIEATFPMSSRKDLMVSSSTDLHSYHRFQSPEMR